MFLDKNDFVTIIDSTPLVSIDLLIENSKGQYLLGLRNNRPAQGFWFVPGGRIFKNEPMDDAFIRLCKEELGIDCSITKAEFLGPFEHFYDDCVFNDSVSTHYVVLGYKIVVDIDTTQLPNAQHHDYRWFTRDELLTHLDVHKHSKWYLDKGAE